jgi:hypothetical protein
MLASETREILYRALGVQRLLNLEDVMRLLRSEVERAGSQRAFARKAGVDISVVSRTLRGMRLPSEKILRALKAFVLSIWGDSGHFDPLRTLGGSPVFQ